MAVVTGTTGKVTIGANTVAEIDTWSLTVGPNLADTAALGDTWEEKTATLKRWSGTASGRFDNTDTNGAVALRTGAINGTTVALKLYDGAATFYSGNAFIELSPSASVSGTLDFSFSFTGHGALDYE